MNMLPLDTWRREMGIHPWHFWGLADSQIVPVTTNCDSIVAAYAWQRGDKAGREEVRRAIVRAEEKLRLALGFRVAPTYTAQTVDWPHGPSPALVRRWNGDASGRRVGVRLRSDGYVQALGVEQLTTIATANVVYSDADGDGLSETATITTATTVTNPDEIAVYNAVGDRLDGAGATDRWRIQPLTVSISGGVATIRGKSWLFVRPVLNQSEDATFRILDPTDVTTYVTTVAVYRRSTNPDGETPATAQTTLWWETIPALDLLGCCCSCAGTTSPADSAGDPAAQAYAVARGGIRDERLGIITPGQAVRNATTGIWSEVPWTPPYEPDRVTVRYLAGWPLESGQMATRWQQIVAKLAAAELEQPICACRETNRQLHYWQQDLTLRGTETELFNTPLELLRNPFGTRHGHVAAWQDIQSLIVRPGLAPG